MIDGAEAFLNQHIPVAARIQGWKRIDMPAYPLESLREAVVNAIVHRDYSKRGESIRVVYFADRIEIRSPGLLLPGVTVEQMEQGTVQSKLRNPILASLLRDLPGYMEKLGSGIRLMLAETKRMGTPAPLFREVGEFVVTFFPTPATTEPGPAYLKGTLWTEEAIPAAKAAENRAGQDLLGVGAQEQRLSLIMQYVQEHGMITNMILRGLTGISATTARRDLDVLVSRNALREIGATRDREYRLP